MIENVITRLGAFFLRAAATLYRLPRMQRALYRAYNAHQFADIGAHETMLADEVRVNTYARAIARYVERGDRVVDLGTGNGILSFLAANQGAEVYALDHSNIIDKAKRVADANGLGSIQFIRGHSSAFRVSPPVDVIIHEQMSDSVFAENMVANVVDLRDRVLKKGGRILPSRFEFYVEPVQLKDQYRVPFIWEQRLHGISYEVLRSLRQQLDPAHFLRLVRGYEIDRRLCRPEPVITFDLSMVREEDLPRRVGYRREVVADGRLDGFAVYFSAAFDDEIRFDTAPDSRSTAWKVLLLRVEAQPCRIGDTIVFALSMKPVFDNRSWRWRVRVEESSRLAVSAGR